MANKHRGDVDLEIGGEILTLRLTLGALAEIESAFGVSDLVALGERLATGRFSALDLVRVLAAAARGAGHRLSDADFAARVGGGNLGACIAALSRLLALTFGDDT